MSIIGLVGFVLAIVLGVYFMEGVSKWLATETDEAAFGLPILAFLLIFFSTLFLANLAGKALKKMVALVLLGGLDSLGGAVLGIVRTGFFISLLVWVLGRIELDIFKDWEKKSKYLSYLKPLTPGVLEILSPILPTVKEAGQELLEKVEKGSGNLN